MPFLISRLAEKLNKQQKLGLTRSRTVVTYREGTLLHCHDQHYLSFLNNDYLGLSQHPDVIKAFQCGALRYGVGSSGSALLGGYYDIHKQLEENLADFLGYERAIVFSSGYMANLAILMSLTHSEDEIFEDKLNHASLIDAGLYCKAQFKRYRHNDILDLEKKLRLSNKKNKWIISDGVFSMSGEIAPLSELVALSQLFDTQLLIDDAHGIGVLGQTGKGILEHHPISSQHVPILVGTFGKAFGTQGAFVAGEGFLIESLLQFARGYIYTTALSPALACATMTSLKIIQKESWRREYLQFLIDRFSHGARSLNLPLLPSKTPIQVIILNQPERTMQIANLLKQHGILVGAIRPPPTVPPHQARLRINLNIHHTQDDIDHLLDALAKIEQHHVF